MTWVYDDGGRAAAGRKGHAGDCVTRAIAIATGEPYDEVYAAMADGQYEWMANSRLRRRRDRAKRSARNGVNRKVYDRHLTERGWRFVPTMSIGSGCKVHLRADELPKGTIIARLSRHLCAVIDGVIHDTHDPSRDGTRCVYGYYVHDTEFADRE